MEEIINNQNVEQQPTTQPADNGKQGNERTFTQAEVDRIVKERLERDRAKRRAPAEPSEAEKKEMELTAKENRLTCREHLLGSGLPSSLLDVLDTSNPQKFKSALDAVSRHVADLVKEQASGFMPPAPLYNPTVPVSDSPVSGFDRGVKHIPKQYPHRSIY